MSMNKLKMTFEKMDKMQLVSFAVIAIIVLYVSFGIKYVPQRVLSLFSNKFFNFIMFTILAIVSIKCPCTGIMLAVALIMTMCAAKYSSEGMEDLENYYKDNADQHAMSYTSQYAQIPEKNIDTKETIQADQVRCPKTSEYRNDFYPSYVNSDYYAYDSKDNQQDIKGFDETDNFELDTDTN